MRPTPPDETPRRGARPRNVLLVTPDQLRGDCISMLGASPARTPHLDRLASESTVFARHYGCAAPCAPARATLLTGLYPCNHRVTGNGTPLDDRHPNLARLVAEAGLDPVLFGYTDTDPDPRALAGRAPRAEERMRVLPGFRVGAGFNYDTDTMAGWLESLAAAGVSLPDDPMDVYLPEGPVDTARNGYPRMPARYPAEASDSAWITDRVIEYLDSAPQEPWLIHAVYLRPHPPLVAPAPYHTMYDEQQVPLPVRMSSRDAELMSHPYLARWYEIDENASHRRLGTDLRNLDDADMRRMRAVYYGLVTEVDMQIGRLLDHLRATGKLDDTLVIVTSDHGELLGDHWLWGKGGFHDGSYHVPLIVRDPLHPRPAARIVDDRFTEGVDVLPTIAEWLGCEAPAACDGRSLLGFCRDREESGWRDATFWEFDFRSPHTGRAERAFGLPPDDLTLDVLRDERFKYVHFTALPPLLFDLAADPGECRNVAAEPAYASVLGEYARRLLSLRMRHADRTLANHRFHQGTLHVYGGSRG